MEGEGVWIVLINQLCEKGGRGGSLNLCNNIA